MRAGAPWVRLLVEPTEQLERLVGVRAAVCVPGLVAELLVEGLADGVEDRLLGGADGALGVPEDLAGNRLRLLHQALVRDHLTDQTGEGEERSLYAGDGDRDEDTTQEPRNEV